MRINNYKKVLIAVPTDRNVEIETFESIYNMFIPSNVITEIHFHRSYCIDIARTQIARMAMEKGFDYILWIDSDMVVPKNALESLLKRDKDIISGLASYKALDCTHVVAKRHIKDFEYENLTIDEVFNSENEVIEVDGVGFGVTLTKVEIFKNIKYPYFVFTEAVGEDIDFSRKAINAGYKLYIDNQVLCGHIGRINFEIKR